MSPSITIGLPVYNAMPFLPATVESLLAQRYARFSILAIDDGSTDDSLAYLRSIRDHRMRVITQENRGLTRTLNRMLAEVDSPWLMRHDADDIAYPDRVERTYQAIQKSPDAGMFYGLADYNSGGARCGLFRTTRGSPDQLRQIVREGYLLSICHPTVTLHVEKTLQLGGYRFDLHVEDADLWWRMALEHEMVLIPEILTGFRHNTNSISAKNLQLQSVNALFVQYLLLSHLLGETPLPYEQVKPKLGSLLDGRKLRFREQIRLANVKVSQRDFQRAAYHAGRAFAHSPGDFLLRVIDEIRPDRLHRVGEDPKFFHNLGLWSSDADLRNPNRLQSARAGYL